MDLKEVIKDFTYSSVSRRGYVFRYNEKMLFVGVDKTEKQLQFSPEQHEDGVIGRAIKDPYCNGDHSQPKTFL